MTEHLTISSIQRAGVVLVKGDFDAAEVLAILAMTHPDDFLTITGNTGDELKKKATQERNITRLRELTGSDYASASNCVDIIVSLLNEDHYVGAIKHTRAMYGLGLKEAKDYVCMVRESIS